MATMPKKQVPTQNYYQIEKLNPIERIKVVQ
jgi:hypothetical protein